MATAHPGASTGIRWAVGEANGRRSSTWMAKGNSKGDVYVAVSYLGGIAKLSLHKDRRCHVGFTSEYAERAQQQFGTVERHWSRWKLPEGPAVLALQIIYPEVDLRAVAREDRKTLAWIPASGPNALTVVSIVICEPALTNPPRFANMQSLGVLECQSRTTLFGWGHMEVAEPNRERFLAERRRVAAAFGPGDVSPHSRAALWFPNSAPCPSFIEVAFDTDAKAL